MTQDHALRPNVDEVLAKLKDFQRDTVDYVFNRLYVDDDRVSRFLIADEVGLGKTLVARGIIAKAVDYLWDQVPRLDIVYICSNLAIAQQNIDRLNITADREFQLASRLTLLPITVEALQGNKLNFVSLTPGTSFNLRSRLGRKEERAVLFELLREHWDVPTGTLRNILRGTVNKENWKPYLPGFRRRNAPRLDDEIQAAFYEALDARPELRARYAGLADDIHPLRTNLDRDMRHGRNAWVGELRRLLARCSLSALEPDLIILDEFQRFKYLLRDEGEIARLAREMFAFEDVKVLLLSATPYKMYTLHGEHDEHHYADFLDTVSFLLEHQPGALKELQEAVDAYRDAMLRIGRGTRGQLVDAKTTIEHILRKVMVRTERLAVTADRNGMLEETMTAQDQIQPTDLRAFVHLDAIARELDAGDQVSYWKSASYPLNMMDDYKLKRQFSATLDASPSDQLVDLLSQAQKQLLTWEQIQTYQKLDPGNARLRALWQDAVETGNWQLLWMPPALPYYQPGGPFQDVRSEGYTKTLIFSAWRLVPKCIAMLLSYDVERRMLETQERDFAYDELTERRSPLLNFAVSEERLTGMPVFCLTYPCLTLVQEIDPLQIAATLADDGPPSRQEMLKAVRDKVETLFQQAATALEVPTEGRADESWYWAALALLDHHFVRRPIEDWLLAEEETFAWPSLIEGEVGSGRFGEHVEAFRSAFNMPEFSGPPPSDLLDVLTHIALSSPAVTALRGLRRLLEPQQPAHWPSFLQAAARIGMGLRSLFNQPEAISLLQGLHPEGPYWKKVLYYSLDGNLQAVLDEYFHVLQESLGLLGHAPDVSASKMSKRVHTALSIRAPTLRFDEISVANGEQVRIADRGLRCRYALRFGDDRNWDDETRTRDIDVRIAFNSPFRPFVLATTSIGQEGLDFHQYCHRVVHWNLPSNPVDLEQREGRVHRYKGHVIRRNLALDYGLPALAAHRMLIDPWTQMFEQAVHDRPEEANDLVPFWIYEMDGDGHRGFKIERRVPVLPLSSEIPHMERLKESLVAYRSVIGQPRQQELLAFLASRLSETETEELVEVTVIDLSPPKR
jgi:hypothetical protein